jgi:hypothetical protein
LRGILVYTMNLCGPIGPSMSGLDMGLPEVEPLILPPTLERRLKSPGKRRHGKDMLTNTKETSVVELCQAAHELFDEELVIRTYWNPDAQPGAVTTRRYVIIPQGDCVVETDCVAVYDKQQNSELVATVCI